MKNNKKKNLNIGIIWANPFSKNLGVAALGYSILYLFRQIEIKNDIRFKILMIGSEGYKEDSIKVGGYDVKFKNIPKMNFMNLKSLLKIAYYTKGKGILDLLKMDYVFDISEGDSFSDIYGVERFKTISSSKRLFNLLNKKQFLLPQTIGPFSDKNIKEKAFNLIKKMECIYTRDKQSYDYVIKNILHPNIHEGIDIAFSLPYTRTQFNNNKVNVGINISGLLWNGGYSKNNQFGLKVDYQQLILEILSYFTNMENIQIHLVGHVFAEVKDSVEDDFRINIALKDKFPEVEVAPRFRNPVEAKNYISGLDFFIGSRMHACIAAFSSCVPVYPLAYSRKFNGLFKETLNYEYLGDLVRQQSNILLANINNAFLKKGNLKNKIKIALGSIVKGKNEKLKKEIFYILN